MIESIHVIGGHLVQTIGSSPTAALIAIVTPGQNLPLHGGVGRLLRLEFDTLEAELEAASLRVAGAAAAVPFSASHALRIAAFLAELHASAARRHVYVCESEGLSRSVTIARWAARRYDIASHAALVADGVPSCFLMAQLLASAAADPAAALARRPVAAASAQPGARQAALAMGDAP
jgi:hypothetical protein